MNIKVQEDRSISAAMEKIANLTRAKTTKEISYAVDGYSILTPFLNLEKVCKSCDGKGEYEEGQFDDVNTVKCICQIDESNDMDDDS